MSYVDNNLLKNEKVLFRAHVSKAVFLPSITSGFYSIISLLVAINITPNNGLVVSHAEIDG